MITEKQLRYKEKIDLLQIIKAYRKENAQLKLVRFESDFHNNRLLQEINDLQELVDEQFRLIEDLKIACGKLKK
jgi:hypothetical protein